MTNLVWLVTGGFLKGYRTQVLGGAAAISALAAWAVGDLSLAETIPLVLGSLGISTLGLKVNSK